MADDARLTDVFRDLQARDSCAAEGIARVFLRAREVGDNAFTQYVYPSYPAPFDVEDFQRLLIDFGERAADWVRPVETWEPDHGGRAGVMQLARHLFVKYEMPEFMDTVWRVSGPCFRDYHDWYVSIGAGRPVRERAPALVTRAQAHWMMQAPDCYHLPDQFYRLLTYADVRAQGGEAWLAVVLSYTELGDSRLQAPGERDFWMSVVKYFIEHPEFPHRQYQPLVSFLAARKFGTQRWPGMQPHLHMKGRTRGNLLREMLDWGVRGWMTTIRMRGQAGWMTPPVKRKAYPPAGIGGFERIGVDGTGWRIAQVQSHDQLFSEAIEMRNCMLQYDDACTGGGVSLWIMTRIGKNGTRRSLAIEVGPKRRVMQASGPGNRKASQTELTVLGEWARAQKIVRPRRLWPKAVRNSPSGR